MPEPKTANPIILKILNGAQAGVEVSLPDGTYTVGSGSGDDVQLIDVSLKPGHARLRIGDNKVEIAAQEGPLRTAAGIALEPNSDWQALEPLDVVTAGTMRFALGPRSAQWATINDDDGRDAGAGAAKPGAVLPAVSGRTLRMSAVPALVLVLLLGFAAWIVLGGNGRIGIGHTKVVSDLEQVRTALDAFPFGRSIESRQEVDGTVYVNGYVATPVERRALANALEQTGVQARVRLWVLEGLRSEISSLIGAEKLNVSFDLSKDGRLTLDGLILNRATANNFVDMIKDRVFGLAGVDSRIRTAPFLLAEVQKLAEASQLQNWLLLRLDKDLIEVSGALPAEKVDAWVGFLQAYASRFAKDIALRSFVQLQGPGGTLMPAPTNALVIGGAGPTGGDTALDVGKLKRGVYKLGDVFVGGTGQGAGAGAGAPGAGAKAGDAGGSAAAGSAAGGKRDRYALASANDATPSGDLAPGPGAAGGKGAAVAGGPDGATGTGGVNGAAGNSGASGSGGTAGAPGAGGRDGAAGVGGIIAGRDLTNDARSLLERWRDGKLGTDPASQALKDALETLRLGDGSGKGAAGKKVPDWYLPLFSAGSDTEAARKACWPDADLHAESLPPLLFWLDLLSATDSRSLKTFSRAEQTAMLEVALNPKAVQACAARVPAVAKVAANSLYLREIRRNPLFVRFIVRDLTPFAMDIAGVDLSRDRFILTRAGLKLHEGAAPDRSSRLAIVGELGVAIQQKDGLSAVIFDPEMNWRITQ